MATSAITTASETKEWVLACSENEQCEIEVLKNNISFVESELQPPIDPKETLSMYLLQNIPRDFQGDGTDSIWVFIDNKDIVRKRPYTPMRLHDANGNPIGSFDGALDIHDADVHTIPVNEYFHRHTGISTTLAVASAKEAREITVADATGFTVDSYFQIENGVIETTFPRIIAIVGNTFTLDRPLDNAFNIGDNVEAVSFDMNVDGSITPVAFRVLADKDQVWHIVRFLFSMTHGTAGDLGLFGNLPELAKPVILRGYNATADLHKTFTSWRSNSDIKDDMYDVDFDTRSSGGGTYGTTGRGSIKMGTGASPRIDGAVGDYLEILIQSDLTGLESYRLKAQGHIEGL